MNREILINVGEDALADTCRPSFVAALTVFISADRGHCNKTVDIYEDVSSPAVTPANWGKPLSCWYRFRAFRGTPRDWILRVRFKKFKVGVLENATTCSGGYLQVSVFGGEGNFIFFSLSEGRNVGS